VRRSARPRTPIEGETWRVTIGRRSNSFVCRGDCAARRDRRWPGRPDQPNGFASPERDGDALGDRQANAPASSRAQHHAAPARVHDGGCRRNSVLSATTHALRSSALRLGESWIVTVRGHNYITPTGSTRRPASWLARAKITTGASLCFHRVHRTANLPSRSRAADTTRPLHDGCFAVTRPAPASRSNAATPDHGPSSVDLRVTPGDPTCFLMLSTTALRLQLTA